MMEKIKEAVKELKKGNLVLIHDSGDRENEVDLVVGAEFVRPEDVATMRQDGGGLICLAMSKEIGETLSLPFMTDILEYAQKKYPSLNYLKANDIPYDEKSSFSLTINHRETFTGIFDQDRALTIREFGKFCRNLPSKDPVKEFGKRFRSPGHVPLLLSSGLDRREGHTELSLALLKMAKLTPVAVVCEMLDSQTHRSLSKEKAIKYAEKNHKVFLEGSEIKLSWNNPSFQKENIDEKKGNFPGGSKI